jgi:hypothetical protein
VGDVDRRGFFRSLALRGAARRERPAPPSALPSQRCATGDELAELAAECGLVGRADDVRALARTSVRLTRTPGAAGRSHLGGSPDLPAAARPPGLSHVVQLDLAEVARVAGGGLGLPTSGLLWCFRDGDEVRLVAGEAAPRNADPARVPLGLSAELVLPRVWAAPAQALGLSADETGAWEELRARLAAIQDVEAPRHTPEYVLRLRGYPEDRRGDMPLRCELRSRGHDVSDDPPDLHPAAAECESAAARWRLLLQLPADPGQRLFVWIPDEQLSAGDLAGALAVVR